MPPTYLLVQIADPDGSVRAARIIGNHVLPLVVPMSVLEMAHWAIREGRKLGDILDAAAWGPAVPLSDLLKSDRLLPPITHPDPTRLHASGTGLTHLGSADARNKMHGDASTQTDSMKMFISGVEGGRPKGKEPGAQPEWFYKGNGHALISPGAPIQAPSFALDGGEEPELAGIYLIGPDATPFRLGFVLANEFSDHVLEKQNYLLLAHSKLRPFSIGPALRVGDLPLEIRGQSRILRHGQEIWARPFCTGESNMSHSVANLEHHHFKYEIFRKPADVHVHMFGTSTLSFTDGIRCNDGDIFEISAEGFGPPLRNTLRFSPTPTTARVAVRSL